MSEEAKGTDVKDEAGKVIGYKAGLCKVSFGGKAPVNVNDVERDRLAKLQKADKAKSVDKGKGDKNKAKLSKEALAAKQAAAEKAEADKQEAADAAAKYAEDKVRVEAEHAELVASGEFNNDDGRVIKGVATEALNVAMQEIDPARAVKNPAKEGKHARKDDEGAKE